MKKVAVISFEPVFGRFIRGGGAEVSRRAIALKDGGLDVKIFSFSKKKDVTSRPEIESLYYTHLSIKNMIFNVPLPVSMRQSRKMLEDIDKFQPDVVIIEGFQSSYMINKLIKYNVFLRVHNIESAYHRELSLSAKGLRKLYHYITYLQYRGWQNYIANFNIDFVHISDKERRDFETFGNENVNITIYPVAKPITYDLPVIDKVENIVIFGDFGIPSNSFSVKWFIDNIFNTSSSLQNIKLHIIGLNSEIFSGDRIFTYGYVDSLSETISSLTPLVIHPICYGGGIKIKSIDTLISGIPAIYSYKALEGLVFLESREIFKYDEFSVASFEEAFNEIRNVENRKRVSEDLKRICQIDLSPGKYIEYVKEKING